MRFWNRKKKYGDYEIQPDEILFDSMNVSGFNRQQFEGVIEQPIHKRALVWLAIIFSCIVLAFFAKLFFLQIIHGESYYSQSENNRLNTSTIFAQRGVVYDRNGVELIWNEVGENDEPFYYRAYIDDPGFAHVLGYVQYPKADKKGIYWREGISGQSGVERYYNDILGGENGAQLLEVDARGAVVSQNSIRNPQPGKNITTTIDSRLQKHLQNGLIHAAEEYDFVGGATVVMDAQSGALLSLSNYPEYDSNILSRGADANAIESYFQSKQKPFLNRSIGGLYTPGSTVKPFLALAALHEDLITKNTTVRSVGRIEIPNKYNPENVSVFRDWKTGGHGVSDVTKSIAESVNTFFYAIGGGYQDQDGLGIANIERYARMFGIAEKTGVEFDNEVIGTIPNPEWKKRLFQGDDWRLGDTYITSIGQFGFQVSPIQMTRSLGAIANNGTLYTPYLVAGDDTMPTFVSEGIDEDDYALVRRGMRKTVTEGTAQLLNIPEVDFAVKTGTAQVGVDNEFYHSWLVGFFPYEDPQYSFAMVLEKAPEDSEGSASRAMKFALDGLLEEFPEFFDEI